MKNFLLIGVVLSIIFFYRGLLMRREIKCCNLFLGLFLILIAPMTGAKSTRKVMDGIFKSYVELIPFLSSEKKFFDKKNEKKILTHLTNISQYFAKSKHQKLFGKAPGLAPSFEMMNTHLKETIDVFDSGHKLFAYKKAQATGAICMTCHTQLDHLKKGAFFKHLSDFSAETFSDSFAYAEFLFLVRSYKKSVRYYKKAIDERILINKKLKSANDTLVEKEIKTSLQRIITIYTKIDFNPIKARTLIEDYAKNKQISLILRENINAWVKNLKIWEKNDPSIKSNADITKFVKTYLSKIDTGEDFDATGSDISLLVASGKFSHYLRQHPQGANTPMILYWLAKTERKLNHNYFYSLAELYLEKCITDYAGSASAKNCFKQYENDLILGFSGSAGTFIPKNEKRKLEKLRALLK